MYMSDVIVIRSPAKLGSMHTCVESFTESIRIEFMSVYSQGVAH